MTTNSTTAYARKTEAAEGAADGVSGGTPDCARLCQLFDSLFLAAENTRLLMGGTEPVYLPAGEDCDFDRIICRQDYVSSALHEVAHWCIAGSARRRLPDYGYWYRPDGRSSVEQHEFERVEARPQALEWMFHQACGLRFRPSADNLALPDADPANFEAAIVREAQRFCLRGLPPRAARFHAALARASGRDSRTDATHFETPAPWSAA